MKVRLAFALATLLTSGVALADSAADKAAATAHYKKGGQLLIDGKTRNDRATITAACGELRTALRLYDSPKIVWNLALCEFALERYSEALIHFREYERRDPNGEAREALPKYKAESLAKVGLLEIDAPAGARVVVDSIEVGRAPIAESVPVAPGPHAVAAELPASVLRTSATVPAGGTERVTLAEPQPSTAATPPPAKSAAPLDTPPPPPGLTTAPFWTTRRTVGASLVGVGAVGIAGGVLFAGAAQRARDAAGTSAASLGPSGCLATSAACTELASQRSAQARNNALGAAFLGVGAAAAIVGGVLFLLPSARASSDVAIAPIPLPGGAGISLSGALQ